MDPIELIRRVIVAEAKTWLGTPWVHQAAIKGCGVDCGKLVYEVYATVGLIGRTEIEQYSRQWMLNKDEERMLAWAAKLGFKQILEPKAGDILVWRVGRTFSHAGIVADWPTFIHADSKAGLVVRADADNFALAGRDRLALTLMPEG